VTRSSPDLQDLIPYSESLYQKALEIVCLARVWSSTSPFAPEKKQQMMVDSLPTRLSIPAGALSIINLSHHHFDFNNLNYNEHAYNYFLGSDGEDKHYR
jgi:hypothetical protein